jgi:UDP-glucose 4-epimerase
MRVLVTGGIGYIGSHICLDLLRHGHDVHVVDSLINSRLEVINRIKQLTNRNFEFTQCDIRDTTAMSKVFSSFCPDSVIHLAGLKAVGESVSKPSMYYSSIVGGTANLLDLMDDFNCKNIVFSSSATVYGEPQRLPCNESHPTKPINPYGRAKLMAEELLRDWSDVDHLRRAVALRYFNPVGADPSGIIGEDPHGVPNNLMPLIAQVAIGSREYINVFGADYATIDGTGVRDYIHVTDLAAAHVTALQNLTMFHDFEAINVGRGKGASVLDVISTFEEVAEVEICYKIAARRSGDAPAVWADVELAKQKLNFVANRDLFEMCKDLWRWQRGNPNGYD